MMSEVIGIVDHVLHAYYLTSRLLKLRQTTITKETRFKLLIPFLILYRFK